MSILSVLAMSRSNSTFNSESGENLAEIVPLVYLPRSVRQRFTYRIPREFADDIAVGKLVTISFRSRSIHGVIVAVSTTEKFGGKIKDVSSVLPYPPLTEYQHRLAILLQQVFAAPETLAYKIVVPNLARRPTEANFKRTTAPKIDAARVQPRVIISARGGLEMTDVMAPLTTALQSQQQVLCLTPDLYLNATVAAVFERRFPGRVVRWHSDLSSRQQSEIWLRLANGESLLVVGTRGALFLPFKYLTQLLITEADDDGFKSWDQQPYYDVRTLARELASISRLQVTSLQPLPLVSVLSSVIAPPPTRDGSTALRIIARKTLPPHERRVLIPEPVAKLLAIAVANNQRCLIFVNRQGYGSLRCAECGSFVLCPQCEGVLRSVKRRGEATLFCPRCSNQQPIPTVCGVCSSARLQFASPGIEKVVEYCRNLVPHGRVLPISSEEQPSLTSLHQAFQKIHQTEANIVVATNAILPRLWTLPRFETVVVLDFDGLVAIPHFAATERSLITLTRLRAAALREFIVLTSEPNHPVLKSLIDDTIPAILETERITRKRYGYPPFRRLVRCTVPANVAHGTMDCLQALPDIEVRELPSTSRGASFLLKVPPAYPLSEIWSKLPNAARIDVDPIDLT